MRNERDEKMIHAGLDVGSTTAKAVALNDQGIFYFKPTEDIIQTLKSNIRNHARHAKKNVA